jgi:hypothetical protein
LASVIDRHGKIMEKGMGQIASPHWGDIALAITGIVTLVLGILAFGWGWRRGDVGIVGNKVTIPVMARVMSP